MPHILAQATEAVTTTTTGIQGLVDTPMAVTLIFGFALVILLGILFLRRRKSK